MDREKMQNAVALAEAGSAMAEKHGAEVDVDFNSNGGGFDFNQQYRFTLGQLQAKFKTNPLAPVLFRMMESQHAVTMELIAHRDGEGMQTVLVELGMQNAALLKLLEIQLPALKTPTE